MTWIAIVIMTACVAGEEAGGPRIGTRLGEDGVYEFYDRLTNAAFRPTGFSYVRLNKDSPHDGLYRTFAPEHFDLNRANDALAAMSEHGYNTVRVLISGSAVMDEHGGVSTVYLKNLAMFIRRVRDHGMQSLLVMPIDIPVRHPENEHHGTLVGTNWLLLSEEAVTFREAFMKEFIVALRDTGAPMSAVLGYSLNKWSFRNDLPPFSLDGGYTIQTISGRYSIRDADDATKMMREGLITFSNRIVAAVKSVSPGALVGMGVVSSQACCGDRPFNDVTALLESDLDYIGLGINLFCVEESGADGINALFPALGVPEGPDKPFLVEECDSVKLLEMLSETVDSFTTRMAAAEQRGVRGWLFGTGDCVEQVDSARGQDFWRTVDGDRRLLRALAPPSRADGVPPPEPVTTDVRVGVYVFPGWYRDIGTTDYDYPNHDQQSEWRLIREFAHPRPILGFYDDSLPEVNDWHIHWASAAGISWFAFDWYWNAGEKRLSWSLDRGFLEAAHNETMDFCIHWCNHGLDWRKPLDFSADALMAMVQYMAEQYFTRSNYLKIDERPVLMVWDIQAVFKAQGGEETFAAEVLPKLNAICHEHGLRDLYLIHVDNSPLRLAAVQVGDAITGYSYAHLTTETPFSLPGAAPYSELVEALPMHWDRITEMARLPFIISTQAGWDSTPRTLARNRNPQNRWVRTDNTVELFEATLREGRKRIAAELPFFVIEAWNEWGEGSFIEPSRSHGFGHLEAVRAVFAPDAPPATWHRPTREQTVSFSVLRGDELKAARRREREPDPPPPVWEPQVEVAMDPESLPGRVTHAWEFDAPSAMADIALSSGIRLDGISERTTRLTVVGDDPHIVFHGDWGGPASERALALRLRYRGSGEMHAEFFWAVDGAKLASGNARRYQWMPGDAFHTYLFRFRSTEKTRGTLTTFRFDLPDEFGAEVDLKWVRILEN